MAMHRRPRWIPAAAVERPDPHFVDASDFFLRGKRVGRVLWHPDGGGPFLEERFDGQGLKHGPERERLESGQLIWEMPWVHGVQHGWHRQ